MEILEPILSKFVERSQLPSLINRWQITDERVVFTNGVFDILHRGHLTLLTQAKALGTKLVVGLNADSSVKQLNKGADRPINTESDRAFLLAGMACVDAVVIFNEATPIELIRVIEPHVLVKGGDYDAAEREPNHKRYIVGSAEQDSRGAKTVAIPLVTGYSSTAAIEKLRNGQS